MLSRVIKSLKATSEDNDTRFNELANIILNKLTDTRSKRLTQLFGSKNATMILDKDKRKLAADLRAWRARAERDEKKKAIIESSENERRNTGESSGQAFVTSLLEFGILFKSFVHGNTEDNEELPTDSDEDDFPMGYDIDGIGEIARNTLNPRSLIDSKVARNSNEQVFARKGDLIASKDDGKKEPLVQSSEAGNSYHINIGEDNSIGDHQLRGRRNTGWSSRKVNLEMIFVITNFVLELPSTVIDQLSSVHKPQYALLSMLISFAAIFICIVELVYKVRKEKVAWKWRSTLPWLYYPSQTHKPFGNFKDIIGLVCALCQCIVTSINFGFVRRHADNPIKVSVWPIIFAFGLLCSKFLEKPESSS